MVLDKKSPGRWHAQHESVLIDWAGEASSYRYLHSASYKKMNCLNVAFTLPVIILSTIAGVANFSQSSVDEAYKEWFVIGIGCISLISGLITTISQFLSIGTLLEGHRVASIDFSKLSRDITTELALPASERCCSGAEYIKQCRTEFSRLIETSPTISKRVLQEFESRFRKSDFTKPAIIDIRRASAFREEKRAAPRPSTFKDVDNSLTAAIKRTRDIGPARPIGDAEEAKGTVEVIQNLPDTA